MNSPKKKILYVDDDLDDCLLLKQAIHKISPVEIIHAYNGVKALDTLKTLKQTSCLPSLIVLDINMPVMNGLQTLKEIRKDSALNSIPLVIFTTSVNPLIESFKHLNAEVLIKPVDWDSYSHIASKLLSHLDTGLSIDTS